MRFERLDDMVGGWFVGDFEPAAIRLAEGEVGVKRYPAGASEVAHVHRIATEVTVMISGEATLAGRRIGPGDIVVIEPGESSGGFETHTEVVTAVVKIPSIIGDKYDVAE